MTYKAYYFQVMKMKLERLRAMREDRDLKQQKLAQYLHVSQATYSEYESGKINIPFEALWKIADFYNTSVDYLLGRTDNPAPPQQ